MSNHRRRPVRVFGAGVIAAAAAIAVGTLSTAASAATLNYATAFGSFHAQSATVLKSDPYLCITEDNGAAVNHCDETVNLLFTLPITNPVAGSVHTITIQNYWSGSDTFSCYPYAYTGTVPFSTEGPGITFTGPSEKHSTSVKLGSGDVAIQIICWQVPKSDGVATISWD